MSQPPDSRSRRRRDRDARGLGSTHETHERAASRLPSGPRERRPLLAALAVLLIVGGALLAGLLATRVDHRVDMLAAAHTIEPGQVITQDDLASTPVSSNLGTLIPVDDAGQVIGSTARVQISQGQLLDTSQISASAVPGAGSQVVGVALDSGRFPAGGLAPGDVIDVVDVTTGQVTVSGAQVLTAVPTSGTEDDWTSGAVLSLTVTGQDAAGLATAAASGSIAVVLTAVDQPIGAS